MVLPQLNEIPIQTRGTTFRTKKPRGCHGSDSPNCQTSAHDDERTHCPEESQLMRDGCPPSRRTTPSRTWNFVYDKKGAGHWATQDPCAAAHGAARGTAGARSRAFALAGSSLGEVQRRGDGG